MNWLAAERIIRCALEEDLGAGDITTELALPPAMRARGRFIAKTQGVLCGAELAGRAFCLLDNSLWTRGWLPDGTQLTPGAIIGTIECPAHVLLAAERTALNLLQRLSGIATLARQCAERAAPHGIRICETRKTTPGLRILEKHAVRVGGGYNHRIGLDGAIMLKDNHFALSHLAPGELVGRIRARAGHTIKLIAEAHSPEQAGQLAAAGADIVLLDNFSPAQVAAAVELLAVPALQTMRAAQHLGRVLIEVSGGVNEGNLADYLIPGVNVISMGALTHSAPALDISLEAEAL